jgi:hypothetical protein
MSSILAQGVATIRSVVGDSLTEPVITGLIGGGTSLGIELLGINPAVPYYGSVVVFIGLTGATYIMRFIDTSPMSAEEKYMERLAKDIGLGFVVTSGLAFGLKGKSSMCFLNIGISTTVGVLGTRAIMSTVPRLTLPPADSWIWDTKQWGKDSPPTDGSVFPIGYNPRIWNGE